jgi:hypothetical protein
MVNEYKEKDLAMGQQHLLSTEQLKQLCSSLLLGAQNSVM